MPHIMAVMIYLFYALYLMCFDWIVLACGASWQRRQCGFKSGSRGSGFDTEGVMGPKSCTNWGT